MAEEINGYSIIATAPRFDFATRIILGEGYRDSRLIYVVSIADDQDNGNGWHSGIYFDGMDSRANKREAFARFLSMCQGVADSL